MFFVLLSSLSTSSSSVVAAGTAKASGANTLSVLERQDDVLALERSQILSVTRFQQQILSCG
jgi:hypothetical protein